MVSVSASLAFTSHLFVTTKGHLRAIKVQLKTINEGLFTVVCRVVSGCLLVFPALILSAGTDLVREPSQLVYCVSQKLA